MFERNMTELLDEFILVQKDFNPDWTPKFGPKADLKDFQVQLNRARRIMATQVPLAAGETGHKFALEVNIIILAMA